MWSTPKTDWAATDYFNTADGNRWKDNILHIHELAEELYGNIAIASMYDSKSIASFPLASEMNAIENNLAAINEATYQLDIGETQTFVANGHTVAFDEMNRIESATQKIYRELHAQKETTYRYAFTFNASSIYAVPRVHLVKHEPSRYRTQFRLGSQRGVSF